MSDDANGPGYEGLVARRLEELRKENARLCELLGLDARTEDGHAVTWTPTLLAEPSAQAPIDATAPSGEKLSLMQALFGTRTDVYATRWSNAVTGKAGWSLATRGRASRRVDQGLPATDRAGVPAPSARRADIYPLHDGVTCTLHSVADAEGALLVCDFDKGTRSRCGRSETSSAQPSESARRPWRWCDMAPDELPWLAAPPPVWARRAAASAQATAGVVRQAVGLAGMGRRAPACGAGVVGRRRHR